MNNQLAQWLAMYDQNMPRGGSNNYAAGASPWGTLVGRDDDANYAGGRLQWAMQQAGNSEQPPDFFAQPPSNHLAAYVQPREFTEQMPQRKPMNDPMRGQTMNYLAALMGRR